MRDQTFYFTLFYIIYNIHLITAIYRVAIFTEDLKHFYFDFTETANTRTGKMSKKITQPFKVYQTRKTNKYIMFENRLLYFYDVI